MSEIWNEGWVDGEVHNCMYTLREELTIDEDDGSWHIGYDDPLKTIVCKRCGGKEFSVGVGSHFTGIGCVKCLWELCIHEG